jgi:phosphoenolpyruvate carboxylase
LSYFSEKAYFSEIGLFIVLFPKNRPSPKNKTITEEKDYVWFRPWLAESITFRSSMIHPLNVIQKIATQKNDPELLRITVTGISSGMLTTG